MVDSSNIKPLTGSALIQTIVPGTVAQDNDQGTGQLSGLPVGTMISGFVINRDRQSNPILRTEHGDVLVKSDVFLKTGSEVVIRVEHIAAQARARIVRVDNQSIQELIQIQQNQGPLQDDVVMQPSIAQPASLKTFTPEQMATQLRQQPAVLLDAVLLKPASTPTLSPEALLSNVLKLPPEMARAVVSGQSVTLRIVSSDLNIATQASSAAAPVTTGASPAALPGVTGQQYQAYSQQTMPRAGTAIPPLPTTTAQPSPPSPVSLTPSQTPLAAATITASAAMPQPIATATMESLVSPPPQATMAGAPILSPSAPLAPTVAGAAAPAATIPMVHPPIVSPPTTPTIPAPSAGAMERAQPVFAAIPQAIPTSTAAPVSATATPSMPIGGGIIPSTQSIPMTIQSAAERPAMTGLMTAVVLGAEAGGETIVRTPVGMMKLFTATPPPAGSTLQLEWVAAGLHPSAQPLPMAASVLPSAEAPLSALANLGLHWDSLREAAELLQGQPQQLAELTARIPNTKSKLVNDVLFFVSALKSGDVRKWLGDRLSQSIEEKSPGLMQRLSNDFAALRAMTYDQPSPQSWQISTFPMMHEDELHQARLFIRQDEQKSAGGQAAGGVRFLVECLLSQMGEMQLDGFVRKQEGRTSFDLVMRTQHPISPAMEADITALFHEGATQTGYVGQIRFQQSLDHFVRPLQNITYLDGQDDRSIIA